jgi:hypothetical protein
MRSGPSALSRKFCDIDEVRHPTNTHQVCCFDVTETYMSQNRSKSAAAAAACIAVLIGALAFGNETRASSLSAGKRSVSNDAQMAAKQRARPKTVKPSQPAAKNSPSAARATSGATTSSTTTTIPDTNGPAAAPGPGLVWSDEFDSLSIASPENPEGLWRPNNSWQKLDTAGFVDYAGTNWNINPNHPALKEFSPFSIVDGALRIRSFRTPPAAAEVIRAAQEQQIANDPTAPVTPKLSSVPAWCGGVLILNQEVKTVRYRYIEIRSRFPQQGRGMFPALWLYSKTTTDTSADFGVPVEKQAAEIDLLEAFGVPNRWATTLHRKNADQNGPSDKLGMRAEDMKSWHIYGLEWKPSVLRVYRDGVKLYDVPSDVAAFFDVDMAIRMNFAMDAPWFEPSAKSNATTGELAMDIDYVRVYRAKP